MSADREPRSIRHIDPSQGLHRLKAVFQKRFMEKQCAELVAGLEVAISATFAAAPDRRREYLIARSTVVTAPAHEEAQLERALHAQWSASDCAAAEGCWERIVAFQVNLPARKVAEGWGEIDLLGVARDGLPVVIELKRGGSSETPAAVLVQAAAYGLALQRAWWFLREEWIKKVHGGTPPLPTALYPCRIVCAAPIDYWRGWTPVLDATTAFVSLRGGLSARGLPSTFVGLEQAGDGSCRAVVIG